MTDIKSNVRNPLVDYAESASSSIMRELARLALVKSHTQQSLARALAAPASNVARYFAAERPQQSTVARLADYLGMDRQHVRIVQHERLQDEELLDAEHDLIVEVKRSGLFIANAVGTIRECLKQAPQDTRARALAAYLLAHHRADCGLLPSVDPSGVPSALRAFGDALEHRFDLASLLTAPVGPHDTLLLDVYRLLTIDHDINHGQAEKMLAHFRSGLDLANYPVERMDEVLYSSLDYRTGVFQMKLLSNSNKRRSTKKASKDQES